MTLATAERPTDPAGLCAFVLGRQGQFKAADRTVQYKAWEIEKLKFQIAKLWRMQLVGPQADRPREATQPGQPGLLPETEASIAQLAPTVSTIFPFACGRKPSSMS
jgi:hypothetical protein